MTSTARILPILLQPHDVLAAHCEPANGADTKVLTVFDDMLATLYRADGVGLAAPQVGVKQRLIITDWGGEREDGRRDYSIKMPKFYINPEITWCSDETRELQEGCLSLPGLWGNVGRPARVKVKYTNRDGAVVEEEFGGLAAAVIQHEIDHLDGVLFTQRMTKLRRDIAMGKWQKLRKDIVRDGAEFDVLARELGVIPARKPK